jgi:hypothetical protein
MIMANRPNNKDYCPTKEVMTFINDEMFTHERHDKLLVILKGNRTILFQHALCFIRRDFGKKNQGLMMDCKNSEPCVFPRIYYDEQPQYKLEHRVNPTKDLMDKVYYAADVYALSMRHVVGEEKRRLENRMKWVLTGNEEFGQDSMGIGREPEIQKKITDAEKRVQGKKRKGKSSHFKHRPDKTKTARRRALLNSKTDKDIDSNHNPDEPSNDADDEDQDEGQDVDMEGEDADGKV